MRVSEDYAKREGILILRKERAEGTEIPLKNILSYREKIDIAEGRKRKSILDLDKFRKPLKIEDKLLSDLIDNFNWEIARVRKLRGLTRKQVANSIHESEETIKMIENGVLPSDNYIVLTKLEAFLGISVRKGKVDFNQSMRALVDGGKGAEEKKVAKTEDKNEGELLGNDIEIFEEEKQGSSELL